MSDLSGEQIQVKLVHESSISYTLNDLHVQVRLISASGNLVNIQNINILHYIGWADERVIPSAIDLIGYEQMLTRLVKYYNSSG